MPTVTPNKPEAPFKPGRTRTPSSVELLSRDVCEDMKFNPIAEAIKRYRNPKTPQRSKDFCLGLIADRFSPRMRSLEVSGLAPANVGTIINIVAAELGQPPPVIEHIEAEITTKPLIYANGRDAETGQFE